jgi:MerR family transcriptional regulator, thiopeptide resistance regulator
VPSLPSAHYTAAEAARRLGVTIRALRLYERRGLVQPGRTAADWRCYGPAELARLQQVIALKRIGLKLADIAKLLRDEAAPLDHVLALQEEELIRRKQHTDNALALVRNARKHLADGKTLPLEDFVALIKETRMTSFEPSPEYKALWSKYFDLQRLKTVHPGWSPEDGLRFKARWLALIGEAEMLKHGDPGSPQAVDLARRALALVHEFTAGDPALMESLKAMYQEGFADPALAGHMPYGEDVWQFMNAAQKHLHASED